jgi:hypothetical protein
LYECALIADCELDSAHVAPFLHGDDAHSFTSTLHVPPVFTLHSDEYCEILV